MATARSRKRTTVLYALSIAGGLLVWEALCQFVPGALVAPPSAVLGRLVTLIAQGTIPAALAGSIQHMVAGYLLAVAVAVPLGIVVGRNEPVATAVEPVLNAIYMIPPVAFVPFFVIWFGLYFEGRVALVFAMCFFEILINVLAGVRDVDRGLVDAARSMQTRGLTLVRKVILPAALPFIFTGLRVGIGRAVNAMITAELFFSAVHLGKILKVSGNAFDMPTIFAVILTISLFGLFCQEAMRALERWCLPWHHGRHA
jgi:ABC-type nitrate/sulfonate/bicarbonate transport system permease component